jgi:ABC-type sugar transport system ATPase subunit
MLRMITGLEEVTRGEISFFPVIPL